METLIELYSERAIENILGPEVFKPAKVIYLCPEEAAVDGVKQNVLKEYFLSRGIKTELNFIECSLYKSDKIFRLLKKIGEENKDCVLDVTGGTDAALFAAGAYCCSEDKGAFTYSRKKNCFYNIKNAGFTADLPCPLSYNVEDFFRMTGGKVRSGRYDNRYLAEYLDRFKPFFNVFLKYKRKWIEEITFIQRISQAQKDAPISLYVSGSTVQKGEKGSFARAVPGFFRDLAQIGFIKALDIREESISFTFADANIRNWLRDVGSVLELYMYGICLDTGMFHDVLSSVIVDWDGTVSHDSVSNEIDVVASRGVTPVFISCKACEIKTEAINELAILRDRFGGKGAKAVIVTTEICNAAARHRAAQLGIAVIDEEELSPEKAMKRLRIIMKADKTEEKG